MILSYDSIQFFQKDGDIALKKIIWFILTNYVITEEKPEVLNRVVIISLQIGAPILFFLPPIICEVQWVSSKVFNSLKVHKT